MTPFHVALHCLAPRDTPRGRPFEHDGLQFRTLDVAIARQANSFEMNFEAVAETLGAFDRLFWEPDGSFVWTGVTDDQRRWQLDGSVYDCRGHLQYVELKGFCPEHAFLQLCNAISTPDDPGKQLVVQLIQSAVFMGDSEFRRLAFGKQTEIADC